MTEPTKHPTVRPWPDTGRPGLWSGMPVPDRIGLVVVALLVPCFTILLLMGGTGDDPGMVGTPRPPTSPTDGQPADAGALPSRPTTADPVQDGPSTHPRAFFLPPNRAR